MKTICSLLILMTALAAINYSLVYSQTLPQYELTIQNPVLVGTTYQFDIFIKRTGTTNFRIGNSQFIMTYNSSQFISPVISRIVSSEQIGTGFFYDQVISDNQLRITLGGNGSFVNASDIGTTGTGTRMSSYQISGVNAPIVSPQLLWVNAPELIRTGLSEIDAADNYREITDETGASHINGGGEFGRISGYSYNDLNGNGLWDQPAEPPLNGWTITLSSISGTLSAITGSGFWDTGYFEFVNLVPCEYTINELPQADWSKTGFPANPVTISAGDNFQNSNFGNYNGSAILGLVFDDINGNRIKDIAEGGLMGWLVFANKVGGGGSKSFSTNAAGEYTFVFTPEESGLWQVSNTVQSGWLQTIPISPLTYTVDIQSGTYSTGNNFGNFRSGTISGLKYNDFNRDSLKETFEPGMSNWRIRLHKDGVQTDSTLTDGMGNYTFSNLFVGAYTVSEQQVAGWSQTYPALPGTHLVTINTGGMNIAGRNFGNFHIIPIGGIGRIIGKKFEDRNQNGLNDLDDLGLDGWRIRLSIGNTIVDSILTDSNGEYRFEDLDDGIYNVSEASHSGWMRTHPGGNGSYDIILDPTQRIYTDKNFGNYYPGFVSGTVYNDQNHNAQKDVGEPGLAGIEITLSSVHGSQQMSTVAGGGWSFSNLSAGVYTITETLPLGCYATEPLGGTYTVEILSRSDISDLKFGNSLSTDTMRFRTLSYDSLAYAKGFREKIGKSIKKKADKVEFQYVIVNTTGRSANGLHVHFSPFLLLGDTNYPFSVSPTPSKITFSSQAVSHAVEIVWNDSIPNSDTVFIYGWGARGKTEVASYAWDLFYKGKHFKGYFVLNQPRLPMPNELNVRDDVFRVNGFGTEGLIVGIVDIVNQRKCGWVRMRNISAMQQSLINKMTVHSKTGRGFDVYENGKIFDQEQKKLTPQKHNNRLFGDVMALKLNIAASELQILPAGFGELVYDDGVNPLSGLSMRNIAACADSALTYWDQLEPGDNINLDTTIQKINSAFEGPIDTISFSGHLELTGVRRLADITFLRAIAGVTPKIVNKIEDSVIPDEFDLCQNYPNPFNPTTTIEFELPNLSVVTVKVYNVLGQEVFTLCENEIMDEGLYDLEFDATDFASGVYFYRLAAKPIVDDEEGIAGEIFTGIKKMILIK